MFGNQFVIALVGVCLLAIRPVYGESADDAFLAGLPHPSVVYSPSADGRSHRILAVAQSNPRQEGNTYILDAVADPSAGNPQQYQGIRDLLLVVMDAKGSSRSTFVCKLEEPFLYLNSRTLWWIFPTGKDFEAVLVLSTKDDRGQEVWTVDAEGNAKLRTTLKGFAVRDVSFDSLGHRLVAVGGSGKNAIVKFVDTERWEVTDIKSARNDLPQNTWTSIAPVEGKDKLVVAGYAANTDNFGNGATNVIVANLDSNGKVINEDSFLGNLAAISVLGRNTYAVVYNAGDAFAVKWRLRLIDAGTLKLQKETELSSIAGLARKPTLVTGPSDGTVLIAAPAATAEQKGEYVFMIYREDGQQVSKWRTPDLLDHSDLKLAWGGPSIVVGRSGATFSKDSPTSPPWRGAVMVFGNAAWEQQSK